MEEKSPLWHKILEDSSCPFYLFVPQKWMFQKKKRSFVKNIDTLAKIYTYTGKHKLQFIQLGSNERALKENQRLCFISSQISLFIKILKIPTCAWIFTLLYLSKYHILILSINNVTCIGRD